MKRSIFSMVFLSVLLFLGCFGDSGSDRKAAAPDPIFVNSLDDSAEPPSGIITFRSALDTAKENQPIRFEEYLDGGVIELSIVGEEHSVLKGEVMGMRDTPSGPVSYLEGYFERDYGKSALYTQKNVIIDASDLPSGITLSWNGGEDNPARVLAVYGDLCMANVSITGGKSVAEDISAENENQPWTLARGGGVAVWGAARLVNCRIYGNSCKGDFDSSRDRGAFGGGLYADIVDLENCIISGNSVSGGGAAGGGVFSVGGAENLETFSVIDRCSITGNRIRALFTYGGGVYSDGGGIGHRKTLQLTNSTIAQNLAEPAPGLPDFLLAMGYWRGGGVYISNGNLSIQNCTIVQNETYGVPRTDDLSKPNLAGGIAATIGNAHAVETITIGHSLVVGNTVSEIGGDAYAQDIFTGSLMHFKSMGYNRIGALDFSQILVPVGEPGWESLCRRHFPKSGDGSGVEIAEVLDLDSGIVRSNEIFSAGVDASDYAILYYQPGAGAIDQAPASPYIINKTLAEYDIRLGGIDNFLSIVLDRIESCFTLPGFAADFRTHFESFLQTVDADGETVGTQPYTNPSGEPMLTLDDVQWFGPAITWTQELANYPYIEFWHQLDAALEDEHILGMGPELLGDGAWRDLFPSSGLLPENNDIFFSIWEEDISVSQQPIDQLGVSRPVNSSADIGAVEAL
ncbi:MAG: hypothetical protein R6U50_08090 [Desulfobacterales bacterium]